jgi:hypothetical protein
LEAILQNPNVKVDEQAHGKLRELQDGPRQRYLDRRFPYHKTTTA